MKYYHNENLFSEIYLKEITQQPEEIAVTSSLNVIREYRDYADSTSLEAWKESYVHEVLAALGFNVNKETANLSSLAPIGVSGRVTICFVVDAETDLNQTQIGKNWAEKMIRSLRETQLQWGVLTNGKQWRIYHLDEAQPYETYLEIDLDLILNDQAKDAFHIFYKFLKAENFQMDAGQQCQFDQFKTDSKNKVDYIEKELEKALRQREEGGQGVLSDLCMGYVEEIRYRGGIDLDAEEERKKIYHSAMLYMFRLLFLMYADARGLLSEKNHALFIKLYQESEQGFTSGKVELDGYTLWEDLETIFVDIDQTYNGGLFSPQESEFTRFLSDTRIKNKFLVPVLFNLTHYLEKDQSHQPISYRDMSVRHLGTLYEGLLEHKLFITKEDTQVKVSKGKVSFIPVSQGGKLIVGEFLKAGEVYFSGDASERKASGSYYTPEYIVEYIVQNTVGEKLRELQAAFSHEFKPNLEAYQSALDGQEKKMIAGLIESQLLNFVRDQVLQVSVLDPAMGSGHFLVNATNTISNFITEFLNHLKIEGEHDSGTPSWRRWVVENCIYGVDLNPLAVELSKLSLWILSMAKDQPLSFLNHHLKCGNSLVGTWLEEIGNYPYSRIKKETRQLNLFEQDPDFKAAVEEVITKNSLIAGKASANLEDVREKKEWLEEIDHLLNGYKALCDIHTNLRIKNSSIDEVQYAQIFQNKDFTLARSLTPEKYFHWELEFPFLLMKNGFCSVIGNPPYVQLQTMGEVADTLQEIGFETFVRTGDIYCLFYEQGVRLLRQNGVLGLITSNKWMRAGYGEALRNFFTKKTNPIVLVDFSGQKIFGSATVDVNILIIEKAKNKNMTKSCVIKNLPSINKLSIYIEQHSYVNNFSVQKSWSILSNIEQRIKNKIEEIGVPLKDWNIQINYGIKTGLNEAFIISGERKDELIAEDPNSAEIIRPILRGRDIKRYGYDFGDLWLLFIPWHFPLQNDSSIKGASKKAEEEFKKQYPAVYKHLFHHKDKLSARNKVETGITYEWYALQRWGANYWDDFSKQKIMYPNMTKYLPFYLDDKGFFQNDKSFFITGSNLSFLCAFLNSSLFKYCFMDNFPELQGGTRELRKIFFDKIPVIQIIKSENVVYGELVEEIQRKKENGKETENIEREIDDQIFNLYNLNDAERRAIGYVKIQ